VWLAIKIKNIDKIITADRPRRDEGAGGTGKHNQQRRSVSSCRATFQCRIGCAVRFPRDILIVRAETLESTQRFNDPEAQSPHKRTEAVRHSTRLPGVESAIVETRHVPALVTPRSLYGKRIRYAILEYMPLLDSAKFDRFREWLMPTNSMDMNDWIKIATDIEVNYPYFDAFLVLHGTDTMAYTASALSFMLEDLGKTVVITGSQVRFVPIPIYTAVKVPLAEWRTDAEENLLGCASLSGIHI
jgi:lysophospholipase